MLSDDGAAKPKISSSPSARSFTVTATALLSILLMTSLSQVSKNFVPQILRNQHSTYSAIWPQAWTFFASAPDTDTIVVYSVNVGEKKLAPRNILNVRLASPQNLRGLSQRASTQVIETYFLADQIPKEFWSTCTLQEDDGCDTAFDEEKIFTLPNTFQAPTLCGEVAFVVARPQSTTSNTHQAGALTRPVRAVVARLSCSR